jgi:RNA polymerase sigma factor (sigma-70 family)
VNSPTDKDLLRDYTGQQSESAFAELTRRYVDLVYSAALRMVRDAHLAQDVTQAVFVALAQNAARLTDRPVLAGWLHRTTQNLAANAVRSDVRRRTRELEAAVMNEFSEPDASWGHIAPQLDAALDSLSETDRDALLLRYFKGQSARQIAETLGVSDDAAQKRVNRAVDRLRDFFSKQGVTLGASGLAVISANAVQAAPAALAATISTSAALAGTLTVATHATMSWINAKAVTALVVSALAAGTGTYLVQEHQVTRLRTENQALVAAHRQSLQERDNALAAVTAHDQQLALAQKDNADLLRLRNEVATLRRQAGELERLQEQNRKLQAALADAPKTAPAANPKDVFPKEAWAFAGFADPESTIQSAAWAMSRGDFQTLLASLTPEQRANHERQFQGRTEQEIATMMANNKDYKNMSGYQITDRQIVSDREMVVSLYQQGRDRTIQMVLKRIGDEWKLDGPPVSPRNR